MVNSKNLHEFGPRSLACADTVKDEGGLTIFDEGGNPLCVEDNVPAQPFRIEINGSDAELNLTNSYLGQTFTYDFIIDWGDGTSDHITTYNDSALDHLYGSSGVRIISVTGLCPSMRWGGFGSNPEYRRVLEWGRTGFRYLASAFNNCYLLTISDAIDKPDLSQVMRIHSMFYECRAITTGVEGWSFAGELANATDGLTLMFDHCDYFNADLSGWNTTGITNMYGLFNYCVRFNNDISGLDTSAVTNMERMFFFNDTLNHPSLANLDTSACTNFNAMLSFCTDFDIDISGWTIRNDVPVTMASMFNSSDIFNQNIDAWDVSSVTDMTSMFQDAFLFNQGFPTWNTGNVTKMSYMFAATFGTSWGVFNGDISNFDTSSVTTMRKMLHNCNEFNQDISGWDISSVANFEDFMSNGTAFTTANYDLLLNAWSLLTVQQVLNFRVAASYTIATSQTARDVLTDPPNSWTITDGGGI